MIETYHALTATGFSAQTDGLHDACVRRGKLDACGARDKALQSWLDLLGPLDDYIFGAVFGRRHTLRLMVHLRPTHASLDHCLLLKGAPLQIIFFALTSRAIYLRRSLVALCDLVEPLGVLKTRAHHITILLLSRDRVRQPLVKVPRRVDLHVAAVLAVTNRAVSIFSRNWRWAQARAASCHVLLAIRQSVTFLQRGKFDRERSDGVETATLVIIVTRLFDFGRHHDR